MTQKEQIDVIEKAKAVCDSCGYARYLPFRFQSNPDGSIPKSDMPKLHMKSAPPERLMGVILTAGKPRCVCSDCARACGRPFESKKEFRPTAKDPNQLELL